MLHRRSTALPFTKAELEDFLRLGSARTFNPRSPWMCPLACALEAKFKVRCGVGFEQVIVADEPYDHADWSMAFVNQVTDYNRGDLYDDYPGDISAPEALAILERL